MALKRARFRILTYFSTNVHFAVCTVGQNSLKSALNSRVECDVHFQENTFTHKIFTFPFILEKPAYKGHNKMKQKEKNPIFLSVTTSNRFSTSVIL